MTPHHTQVKEKTISTGQRHIKYIGLRYVFTHRKSLFVQARMNCGSSWQYDVALAKYHDVEHEMRLIAANKDLKRVEVLRRLPFIRLL